MAFLALVGACRSGQKTTGTSPAATASVSASASTSASASAKKDEPKPVYPANAGPADPIAQRLCDALYTLPASRKSACCGTTAAPGLEGECTRMLTAALHDGAVTVSAGDVDKCVEDSNQAYAGCDWVTPMAPPIPSSCRRIVRGQLDEGKRCRSALECKAGLQCQGVGPTDAGTCAKPAATGAACFMSVDALFAAVRESDDSEHPACAGACIAKKCADSKPLGADCSASSQCSHGDHCADGKCVAGAFAKLGEPCEDACEAGSACVGFKCTKLKGNGESCGSPFECRGACVASVCGMKCSAWPPAGYPGGVGRPIPPARPKKGVGT